MSNGNDEFKTYGTDIFMREDACIEEVLDDIENLFSLAKQTYDEIYNAEHSKLQNKYWYSYIDGYKNSYVRSIFLDNTCTSKVYADGSSVYPYSEIMNEKEIDRTDSLYYFVKTKKHTLGRLHGAIIELRDAVVNYSKGIDVDAARDVINTFHPNFLSSSPYSGYTAPATLEAPEFEKVASVENTSVVSTDDIDGAENIPMEDSITDDITNVSAKDLLEDAVKSSDGNSTLVTAGAASVLSGAGVVGAGISQGIKSSIAKLGKNVDELEDEKSDEDIIEADEPISSLEDDLDTSVSNFVEPELEEVSINGKKVQGKQSSIIIGTGAGAVGVTTAGVLAGKTYMDKKKSEDEDGSEDDDNKFDDFEFENLEEKPETLSDKNVVELKNKIIDDDL